MTRLFDHSPAQRQLMAARNGKIDAAVTLADQLDLGAIYVTFLTPLMHQFLEELGKYFLFPIAAGAHVFKSILAWRQAWIDRKQRSVVGAVVETVAAAAIVAAVVGSLAANGLFALATPIMFTAAIGGKTLYHAGSAVYYAGKASGQKDEAKKAKYRKLAINSGIAAAAGAVATAAVVAVFLLGKIALTGIGIAAAIVGAGVMIYKGYNMHKAEQAAKQAIALEAVDPLQPKPEHSHRSRLNNAVVYEFVGGSEPAAEKSSDNESKGEIIEVVVESGHGMDGSLDRPAGVNEAAITVFRK